MTAPLRSTSSVCALIPHYRCEQWLGEAIESLLEQTHPPDGIVVIDDASEQAPLEIVTDYPEVTLLRSDENSGPYRLVQAVIDNTSYDAYLFQDADDWSAPDRLEVLLDEAARTGAELVGSHEIRILVEEGDVVPVRYPLDVNAALRDRPTSFPLLHPTSLIARSLVSRLGGFSTGMRFSGDAELLRRAGHVARVVNADYFGYFRRKRLGSLTLGSDTALGSPARQEVQTHLAARATANAEAVATGGILDLTPWRVAAPLTFVHLAGPEPDHRRRKPAAARTKGRPPGGSSGPVFVVGAPRSGHAVLTWALGQHPSLRLLHDSRWLARAAGDVEARADEEAAPAPDRYRTTMAAALRSLLTTSPQRPVAGGTELLDAVHPLSELFPDARFVHVVRDPQGALAALAASPTVDGAFYSEEGAWRSWLVATEQGLLLEGALGAGAVLRVRYDQLVTDPATTLTTCLAFLGEEPAPACLRPLTDLSPDAHVELKGSPLVQRCLELEAALRAEQALGADEQVREELRQRFHRTQRRAESGASLVERMRDLVASSVPDGSTLAVISRGDPRMVDLDGRRAWHLPQLEDGTYTGHHPANGPEALEQLQRLQGAGADHLAIPASSLWWLSWYDALREHLDEAATLVAFHEEVGAVYRLHVTAPLPDDGKPTAPRFTARPARQEVTS